jgi:hypothetical protein
VKDRPRNRDSFASRHDALRGQATCLVASVAVFRRCRRPLRPDPVQGM